MYRLIAVDLDGTLLMPGHRLSARTRTAVTSLIERGVHVVVATGRPFEIARSFCPGIPFVAPQISYNGAVVYDPVADRAISRTLAPAGFVPAVIDFLLTAGIPVVACGVDRVYLDERISNPEDWVPPSAEPGHFLRDMRAAPADGIIKIVGDSDAATITRLRPLAETQFGDSLYVTQTSPNLLEFLNPAASKGAALRHIAGTLGIPRREILVFGDSHNDLTMFAAAGFSVAMGNASEEVKGAAGRVTLSNERDGVAVALEEMGLVRRYEDNGLSHVV
ncbi:MAG TPA: Cof-type HAD-IIB family hydrolase [Chloroflexota bacterium]|nr:Cof-type HAD-IIB family hydrolase [Chloroflexota bacterium]